MYSVIKGIICRWSQGRVYSINNYILMFHNGHIIGNYGLIVTSYNYWSIDRVKDLKSIP